MNLGQCPTLLHCAPWGLNALRVLARRFQRGTGALHAFLTVSRASGVSPFPTAGAKGFRRSNPSPNGAQCNSPLSIPRLSPEGAQCVPGGNAPHCDPSGLASEALPRALALPPVGCGSAWCPRLPRAGERSSPSRGPGADATLHFFFHTSARSSDACWRTPLSERMSSVASITSWRLNTMVSDARSLKLIVTNLSLQSRRVSTR